MADGIVYNHDVAGIHRRINRFISELTLSASSNISMTNDHDQARLQTYLDAIRTYRDWVVDQPLLDLPETNQRTIQLDANPAQQTVENESIVDVIRMLELARDEIVNSQSARHASGLIPFDEARLTALVEKIQAFLDNYIAIATPLDLPESSPMRGISGPGRTGV